jgi:transmembrane sensor
MENMSNDDIQEFVIDCITDPDNRDKQAALEEWLRASEENRVLYANITRIWEIAETIPATPFSTTEGWAALSQHISENANVSTKRISNWWWAAAVIIPLCICVYTLKKETQDAHFVAGGTDKDSLQLPDGSLVYAKPGTELTYTKERTVTMEKGEAFFKVVQHPQSRFIVKLKNAAVTVLGTSFNITVDSTTTDVTVWDGKVSMTGANTTIILKEGEMGRLTHNTLSKMSGNYAYRCGWANGYLVFENEEAGDVAAVLSNYYHIQFIVSDSLVRKRITVKFSNLPLEQVEQVFAEVLDK